MLFRCGIQYQYRYLEGRILPPGVSLITGTAVDKAVSKNLTNKIDAGELLPVEQVTETARDALAVEWDRGVVLTSEEKDAGLAATKGAAIDKAVRLAGLHSNAVAPALEPTHVQRSWAVELPGFPFDLAGTIDVQEGTKAVRDTKTTGKTPPANVADVSEQLTVYAMANRAIDGAAPKTVALDYLIDNKEPVARTFESTRTDDDFAVELRRIEQAARVIEAKAFTPPPPDSWWCSARFCGYASVCPYFRKPVTIAIGGSKQ